MAKANQGFRKDLNLQENTNDTQTLSNLGGVGIANDLRIIQNNLRNISTLGYSGVSTGFFYFGASNEFVYTNDDVIGFSANVTIGVGITLTTGTDYYICNSDGETQFKISNSPSSVGISTIVISSVLSPASFNFIRKQPVFQENIVNYIKPEITNSANFNYLGGGSINSVLNSVQATNESTKYFIDKKYKGNKDTNTDNVIKFEGAVVINDPAALNTSTTNLANSKSPGIFIGDTRAFSSDNNPWAQVGTALSTSSSNVSIGELSFANGITITGISTEAATEVAVTSFTHKLPVVINGETYYLLLRT